MFEPKEMSEEKDNKLANDNMSFLDKLKDKKSKPEKTITMKWLILSILVAIVLSSIISLILVNVYVSAAPYSTDTGTIIVQIQPEYGSNEGTITVEIKGEEVNVTQ